MKLQIARVFFNAARAANLNIRELRKHFVEIELDRYGGFGMLTLVAKPFSATRTNFQSHKPVPVSWQHVIREDRSPQIPFLGKTVLLKDEEMAEILAFLAAMNEMDPDINFAPIIKAALAPKSEPAPTA